MEETMHAADAARPTTATIFAYEDGTTLTQGLEVSARSDVAIDTARRMAAERGVPVILEDDDGLWLVTPDGEPAAEYAWPEAT